MVYPEYFLISLRLIIIWIIFWSSLIILYFETRKCFKGHKKSIHFEHRKFEFKKIYPIKKNQYTYVNYKYQKSKTQTISLLCTLILFEFTITKPHQLMCIVCT